MARWRFTATRVRSAAVFRLCRGLVLLSFLLQNTGQRDMRARLLREQLDRFAQGRSGVVIFALLTVDAAQDRPAVAVLRTQFKRGPQIAHRIVEAALLHVEDAERVGRIRRRGIETQRCLQLGDGVGQIVFQLVTRGPDRSAGAGPAVRTSAPSQIRGSHRRHYSPADKPHPDPHRSSRSPASASPPADTAEPPPSRVRFAPMPGRGW